LSADYSEAQFVTVGDFLLNPMDLLSGWVSISPFSGVTSNAYFVFRPKQTTKSLSINRKFYEFVLQSYYKSQIFEPFGKGVGRPENSGGRWTLNRETLNSIPLPFPPIEQQKAIAEFLELELAQTEILISKQVDLISILQQRRSALIRESILHGLNPSVQMQEVNENWIDYIPNTWKIGALKRFATLKTGGTPSGADFTTTNGDHPWLRPDDLKSNGEPSEAARFISTNDTFGLPKARSGATLVCGVGATVGKAGQIITPSYYNQQITAIDSNLNDRYLFYVFVAAQDELMSLSVGNTLPILNNERLGLLKIPIPPIEEQSKIAEHLDNILKTYDQILNKATSLRKIQLERRDALIFSAITGKIDVGVNS
jgi:type I restriction enzyme S subunit